MKNLIILLIICLFPVSGKGQMTKEVVLHFNENDFIFKSDDNGQLYILSQTQNVTYQADRQAPALPLVRINYLIGSNESYKNVSYEAEDELMLSEVLIAPNPEVVPTNIAQTSKMTSQIINYKKNEYPEQNIKYTGTHLLGGFKYLSFLVCPFRYDALSKKLYLMKDITLMINTTTSLSEAGTNRNTSDSVFMDISILPTLRNLVVNNEDINRLYDNTDERRAGEETSDPPSFEYKYLIITNNALKSAFQELAEWKTMKGIKSKVLTTAEISNQYTGTSLQSKIKKALKDYYNGTHFGLKYVLLGGDVDIVPSRTCYIECQTSDSIYYGSTPTDMFYACFHGNFEWDANNNNVYGELDDNVDLAPEIFVTRVPVSTSSEASSFVSRIINYEKNPIATNWHKKLLMGGHKLRYWVDNYYSDSEIKADTFYDLYILPYWSGNRYKLFNTESGASANLFNINYLQGEMSDGYTFADIITHGMPTYWRMRYDNYSITNAQSLENSGRTIITTSACLTNAFDESICLSEAFLRNSYSGILGYLGCSREGFYYTNPFFLGVSYEYNGEFYKGLFTNTHKRFGETVSDAKMQFIGSCSDQDDGYRWIMFGLNPIGDPEMPIVTDTLQKFTNVAVSYINGTLTVNTGVSDCKICVASANDMGDSYFNVNNGISASFTNLTDEYSICITKPGYIPYIARCGNIVYMQNETIVGDYDVFSNQTFAGNSVTTNRPTGPVEINKGSTIIRGTNGVTLGDGFEVKDNASLEIRTN